MKALVTGAGGFIGGHLMNILGGQGIEVTAVDIKPWREWYQTPVHGIGLDLVDLRDRQQVRDLEVPQFDIIYNLAADMGGIGYIENNKVACMLSILINTNLLLEAKESVRYFYASSACIYPASTQTTPDVVPLAEDFAYPAMPEDGYGWEKLFSERMCTHFREERGIDTRIARLHNVYGPYGTYEGGREKAPAAICRKVAEAILDGSHQIEIWGDGEQTRSFMYVDDCVKGIYIITKGDYVEPLNLGTSELVTINQLVGMVEEIAGHSMERVYNLTAPQGVRGRNSDNTLIQQTYGWEPSISLREGLTETYDWIKYRVNHGLH